MREVFSRARVFAGGSHLDDANAGLALQELAALFRKIGFLERRGHVALFDDFDEFLHPATICQPRGPVTSPGPRGCCRRAWRGRLQRRTACLYGDVDTARWTREPRRQPLRVLGDRDVRDLDGTRRAFDGLTAVRAPKRLVPRVTLRHVGAEPRLTRLTLRAQRVGLELLLAATGGES